MVTIILALVAALGTFFATYYAADIHVGWSVFWGLITFAVLQVGSGIYIRKLMKREMDEVQRILTAGQKRLQQKMQRWQMRPPGSIQAAQREIFEDTKVFVKEALDQTEQLRKFRLWVPFIEKQIATAQFQLNWMIKDFKTVDKLMPKVMFLDPTTQAMRIARLHMLGKPIVELKKLYEKAVARTRYNDNVLLAALMSWIEIKSGDVDAAFKTLTEALKKSDNETLKRNHECLMNNRPGHFTNSGLGDMWYSLLLEEPKVRTQRQHPVYR